MDFQLRSPANKMPAISHPLSSCLPELGGGVKLELVLIPPGTFKMGSPAGEAERNRIEKNFDAEIPHEVSITQPFYPGKYPVTQKQYDQVMGKHKNWYQFGGLGAAKVTALDTTSFPVEFVGWKDAAAFCTLAGMKAAVGKAGVLPSEAQWEYACRAGTATAYFFGNDPNELEGYAWYGKNSEQRTHVVGENVKPNAFGLYDMCGNVKQWCMDIYGPYEGLEKEDPVRLDGGLYRAIRGGSWNDSAGGCRSAIRDRFDQSSWRNDVGFRLAVPVR
jgi:formylglycine-generating enzyme required for sulfatase activity